MAHVTFEEFSTLVARRNKGNERDAQLFLQQLKSQQNLWGEMLFARKGRETAEMMECFIGKNRCPIVDKKLNMIIGVPEGLHRNVMALLYQLHMGGNMLSALVNKDVLSDDWIHEKHGYYVQSMDKRRLVVSSYYGFNRSDGDVQTFFIFASTAPGAQAFVPHQVRI